MITINLRAPNQTAPITPIEIKLEAAKVRIEFDEDRAVYFMEIEDLYILRRSADFLDDNIVWEALVSVPFLGLTFTGRIGLEDRVIIDQDYYKVNIRLDPLDYVGKYLEAGLVTIQEAGNIVRKIPVGYELDQLTVQRMVTDAFNSMFSLVSAATSEANSLSVALKEMSKNVALFDQMLIPWNVYSPPTVPAFILLFSTMEGFSTSANIVQIITASSVFLVKAINTIESFRIYKRFLKTRKTYEFFTANMYDLLTFALNKNDIDFDPNQLAFLKKYHVVTHKPYFKIFPILDFIKGFNKIFYFYNQAGRFRFSCVDLDAAFYFPKEYAREGRRESFDYVAYKEVSFGEPHRDIYATREEYDFTNNYAFMPNSYQRIIYPALGSKKIEVQYALGRKKKKKTAIDRFITLSIIVVTIAAIAGIAIITYTLIYLSRTYIVFLVPIVLLHIPKAFILSFIIITFITLLAKIAILAIILATFLDFILEYKSNVGRLQVESLSSAEIIAIFENVKDGIVKNNSDIEILNDIKNRHQDIFVKVFHEETQVPFTLSDWNSILPRLYGIKSLVYYFRDEKADIISFRVERVNKSKLNIREFIS